MTGSLSVLYMLPYPNLRRWDRLHADTRLWLRVAGEECCALCCGLIPPFWAQPEQNWQPLLSSIQPPFIHSFIDSVSFSGCCRTFWKTVQQTSRKVWKVSEL